MSKTIGHAVNSHARSLAEAVILQSIEDLWNPVCKRGSLKFFSGDGFELCSEIAGISYVKQLTMLRMIADAGPKSRLGNMSKAILGKPAWPGRRGSVHTAYHDPEVCMREQ